MILLEDKKNIYNDRLTKWDTAESDLEFATKEFAGDPRVHCVVKSKEGEEILYGVYITYFAVFIEGEDTPEEEEEK